MTTENLRNLEAERDEIVRQLHSPPEPEPAHIKFVDEADQLIAAHEQRIAELKDRRDQINSTFRVRQSEYDETRARERQEAHADAIARIREAEARLYAAVEREEEVAIALADAINAKNAAADDIRRHARDLVRMANIERISLPGLDQTELTKRTAARIAAIMATRIKGISKGPQHRFGGLNLGETFWTLETKPGWAERERRHFGPDVARLTGGQ